MLSRAQGCLLGQIAGDALGSQVEFCAPEEIRTRYPDGLRDLAPGGAWDTLAGQPTDDSEMALALARAILDRGRYEPERARQAYLDWLRSGPFDCGRTVYRGLTGDPDPRSQANGALMRISPLGIFGAALPLEQVAAWAEDDARLTHPHSVCVQANALYAMALARAIRAGPTPTALYEDVCRWAEQRQVPHPLRRAILRAAEEPPDTCLAGKRGWVLIALQNALFQLTHAPSLEDGVVDTVMRGGDTDTNGAICGALLGAVYGLPAVPQRWVQCILNCQPAVGRPEVRRPRPERYWPVRAPQLAEALLCAGAALAAQDKP